MINRASLSNFILFLIIYMFSAFSHSLDIGVEKDNVFIFESSFNYNDSVPFIIRAPVGTMILDKATYTILIDKILVDDVHIVPTGVSVHGGVGSERIKTQVGFYVLRSYLSRMIFQGFEKVDGSDLHIYHIPETAKKIEISYTYRYIDHSINAYAVSQDKYKVILRSEK